MDLTPNSLPNCLCRLNRAGDTQEAEVQNPHPRQENHRIRRGAGGKTAINRLLGKNSRPCPCGVLNCLGPVDYVRFNPPSAMMISPVR